MQLFQFPRVVVTLALLMLLMSVLRGGEAKASDPMPTTSGPFRVLFIGNSHLLGHDVPAQVGGHLERLWNGTRNVEPTLIGKYGAQLKQFVGRTDVVAALRTQKWDAVVLQEATSAFLTRAGQDGFQRSLAWFAETVPGETPIFLFQTWPWEAGHQLYRGAFPGLLRPPRSPDDFWARMEVGYAKAEQTGRFVVAPVGRCWRLSDRKDALYSGDDNHATPVGATYTAEIIARTLAAGRPGAC